MQMAIMAIWYRVPIIPSFLLRLDKEQFDSSLDVNVSMAATHHNSVISYNRYPYVYHMGPGVGDTSTPGYLFNDSESGGSVTQHFSYSSAAVGENSRVGWLLSSKAIVQLFANPFVGPLCNRVGYPLLLSGGSTIILLSSVVFAVAENYTPLFMARSLQGLGSAAATIAGMSIVAHLYSEDRTRSRAMGIAMGGSALGVLLGYPFGGFMYFFVGKTAAFLLIANIIVLDLGLQWIAFGFSSRRESQGSITPLHVLLKDRYILVASGAVMLTTMSMSVLEPTVPLWVMEIMHVHKWELGLIFLPDSIGYLVGTNCFGLVAISVGRWACTLASMLMIAMCLICRFKHESLDWCGNPSFMIGETCQMKTGNSKLPFATAVPQLILPHLGIGLGLGVTDVAIMPLLALLVDTEHEAFYGCVYAIAQLAVCLAYSVGPSVAGLIVKAVGFTWLMRGMAGVILMYCPLCFLLKHVPDGQGEGTHLTKTHEGSRYTKDTEIADEASFSYGKLCDDD